MTSKGPGLQVTIADQTSPIIAACKPFVDLPATTIFNNDLSPEIQTERDSALSAPEEFIARQTLRAVESESDPIYHGPTVQFTVPPQFTAIASRFPFPPPTIGSVHPANFRDRSSTYENS